VGFLGILLLRRRRRKAKGTLPDRAQEPEKQLRLRLLPLLQEVHGYDTTTATATTVAGGEAARCTVIPHTMYEGIKSKGIEPRGREVLVNTGPCNTIQYNIILVDDDPQVFFDPLSFSTVKSKSSSSLRLRLLFVSVFSSSPSSLRLRLLFVSVFVSLARCLVLPTLWAESSESR
jgi:hypothetical protein